jgi:excisionase family DNA binding protein
MTPDEAAKELKVAPGTLRRWLRAGTFKAAKTPAGWRISENDLEQFISARHTGQPSPVVEDEDTTDRAALALADTGDFEDWNAVKARPGQPVDDDDDAYWTVEAEAVLDRIERGEEAVITLEQWETRHGLGG